MEFPINHNEQNKKMMREKIIPIFGLLDGIRQVIATAFIIKQSLIITAAHTFYNEIKEECHVISATRKDEVFEIEVDGKRYPLGKPVYERYSWDYETIIDETYHDLSVFKKPVGFNLHSELELTSEMKNFVFLSGYLHSNIEFESYKSDIYNENSSTRTYRKEPLIRKKFSNCFQLQENTGPGMSGGPVLFQNEVHGMIVFGHRDSGTTAIKAEHILEVIEKKGLLNLL